MMTHTSPQLIPEETLSYRFDSFSPQIKEMIISKLHFFEKCDANQIQSFCFGCNFYFEGKLSPCLRLILSSFTAAQRVKVKRLQTDWLLPRKLDFSLFLMQHCVCDQFHPVAFPTFVH